MMRKMFIAFLYVSALVLLKVTAYAQVATKSKAIPPDRNLKVKASGVPSFDFVVKKVGKNGKVDLYTVVDIPVLRIGREREVSADAMAPLKLPQNSVVQLTALRKHKSPTSTPLVPLALENSNRKAKSITSINQLSAIPEVGDLPSEPMVKTSSADAKAVKVEELNNNDLKLIQALIYLEKHKKYELAMGLLSELMESPAHREQALYSYARTALQLGLKSEFRAHMMTLAAEAKSSTLKEKALVELTQNAKDIELSKMKTLDELVEKHNIDVTKNSDYLIKKAQFFIDAGDLGAAEQALLMFTPSHKDFKRAKLLTSLLQYRKGQLDDALEHINEVLVLTRNDKTDEMRSLAALTKARMLFQKAQFKEAYAAYLLVDKSSPHWLQAMVETAWTQILAGDYEGAAGNMFSLHTDFFKNAFAPDSYVVRTVGYLNLCQYGDSMQVLNDMKKRYVPLQQRMDTFAKKGKGNERFYEVIKLWASNPNLREVEGLPRPFIVELARHPAFISTQKEINTLDDEATRYNQLSLTLVQLEKKLIQQLSEAQKKKYPTEEKREETLSFMKDQITIANRARNSIKNLRTQALARIEKEKDQLKNQAASILAERFTDLNKAIAKVIEQNEVLAYEVYSGAGEHIRYQMAGGDVNAETRPELKAEKDKSLNWKFKGEIWEDEIGHYRSSLKNVCPSDQAANQ